MDIESEILLEANDCFPFRNQEGHSEAIQFFIANAARWNVFHFGNLQRNEDDLEIATFNYRDSKWYAGRLVGEADFDFKGRKYKIRINPRFGNLQLFRMLEEIFNVRFSESKKQLTQTDNYQYLIKKLISFLWLNMLAKANSHGLPRHTVNRIHISPTVRGRIDVRRSINSLYTKESLVSIYREKSLNETIAVLLNQAYQILLKEYYLGTLNQPENAADAIDQIKASGLKNHHVTENQFRKILYKDIYLLFKPVVDLSWDIIKKKNVAGQQGSKEKDSFSFFVDMAEIWELYLKSLLKRALGKDGWRIRNDKLTAYEKKAFQRKLIPDIVLQREDEIMVWDAKYKRMEFDYFDYDRSDFFQIHTYINYYHQNWRVVAGGLLYPISKSFDSMRQAHNRSETLFSQNSTQTVFMIDGIDYSKSSDTKLNPAEIRDEEENFLRRIFSLTQKYERNRTN